MISQQTGEVPGGAGWRASEGGSFSNSPNFQAELPSGLIEYGFGRLVSVAPLYTVEIELILDLPSLVQFYHAINLLNLNN